MPLKMLENPSSESDFFLSRAPIFRCKLLVSGRVDLALNQSRQTLVSPILRSGRLYTICGRLFPKMYTGHICNLFWKHKKITSFSDLLGGTQLYKRGCFCQALGWRLNQPIRKIRPHRRCKRACLSGGANTVSFSWGGGAFSCR